MDNTKRYLKIYELVREDIIEGRYDRGSKLPSKRVMADEMGVSVITVEHAYELLSDEGYITPKEKSGYFVTFDDSEIYTGKGIFFSEKTGRNQEKMDSGENLRFEKKQNIPHDTAGGSDAPKFSYSIYAKTVRRVLSEYDSYIMKKSPKNGTNELRSAIAGYLSRSRRLEAFPEQIII